MAAGDLLWPYEFVVRHEHFPKCRRNEPHGDYTGDDGVEDGPSCNADKQTCRYWGKGDIHVPHVVDVGEPNCRIVASRTPKELSHAPIRRGCAETNDNGDNALNRHGIKSALNCLPKQQATDRHQTRRIEQVCGAQKVSGDSLRKNECQIQKYERHLVGEVVNAVHNKAEAMRLEAGHRLNNKDGAIKRHGGCKRLTIMGHPNLLPDTNSGGTDMASDNGAIGVS